MIVDDGNDFDVIDVVISVVKVDDRLSLISDVTVRFLLSRCVCSDILVRPYCGVAERVFGRPDWGLGASKLCLLLVMFRIMVLLWWASCMIVLCVCACLIMFCIDFCAM